MTAQFDPHRIIKKLVEDEWTCPSCVGTGNVEERAYPPGQAVTTCSDCGGTGRIVPFASLRETCTLCEGTMIRSAVLVPGLFDGRPCLGCRGRGWFPEPDVEKACHRVAKVVQELDPGCDSVAWWYNDEECRWYWNNPQGENIPVGSYKEAVLRSGEALLNEKVKETT